MGRNDPSVGRNDPSLGRNDPSVGRNDPSLGRNDPSIGRNDPSIGRNDPSIGRNDPSLGRNDPSIGRNDPSLGRNDPSLGRNDPSIGRNDPSLGRNDPSIGRNDPSIGRNDPSIGRNDPSIGRNDPSIGRNDPSIGRNDPSIGRGFALGEDYLGRLGPDTSAEAIRARADADRVNENPRFLLPGRWDRNRVVIPSDVARSMETMAGLPMTQRQRDTLADAAVKTVEVAYRLDTILGFSGGMSKASRAALLSIVAENPKGIPARLIEHTVATPGWAKLSLDQREQLVTVLQAGNERGMRLINAVAESRPEVLRSLDRNGNSLVSNLAQLASQPLNSALYSNKVSREALLQDVLRDIVNPAHIDQGNAPTCTVTSMQFELARDNPAEYARLMTGLTGTSGSVKMMGGGTLSLEADYVKPAATDLRALSEVLFQSAAMEYANGPDNFVAPRGVSLRANVAGEYGGLWPSQQTAMLTQLFGTKYVTNKLKQPDQVDRMVEKLRPYVASGQNRPVLLEVDSGQFNHVVTFERMADGLVFYRDPYGHHSSMSEAAFRKHVITVHVPDNF